MKRLNVPWLITVVFALAVLVISYDARRRADDRHQRLKYKLDSLDRAYDSLRFYREPGQMRRVITVKGS